MTERAFLIHCARVYLAHTAHFGRRENDCLRSTTMRISPLFVFAFALLSSTVGASVASPFGIPVLTYGAPFTLDQVHTPIYPLATVESAPGESEVSFLSRVGEGLRAFSDRTGFEACSEIFRAGARYEVTIVSEKSHLACASPLDAPDGFADTGVTIHSHGNERPHPVNDADHELSGMPLVGDMGWPLMLRAELSHFSLRDFASGPGYLATPHGLLYQHGEHDVQFIGAYADVIDVPATGAPRVTAPALSATVPVGASEQR